MESYLGILDKFGIEFVVQSAIMFVILKLVFVMSSRINDMTNWMLEIYYREQMQLRHEQGIEIWPEINEKWFFTEVWILQVYIIAIQQALIIYTASNVFRCNSLMEQIVLFHEQNPDFAAPKFPSEVLESTYSMQGYIEDFLFINVFMAFCLCIIDKRLERYFFNPEGEQVFIVHLLLTITFAFTVAAFFSSFVANKTTGFTQLAMVLGSNGTFYSPFPAENKTVLVNM